MSASVPFVPVSLAPKSPSASKQELEHVASLSTGTQWFRSIWFTLLLASICFEGLGRRYIPAIPATVFYFFKDAILIVGILRFRINRNVKIVVGSLYKRYLPFLKLSILWTVAEVLNPKQASIPLGLLGLRAYWFWWIAPLIVASVLLDPTVRRKVVVLQSAVTTVVALLAFLQFGAPVDDVLNTYSVVEGVDVHAVEVTSTGRTRVSSTFSFISGFSDFAVLVPVLLLSIGLGEADKRARYAALVATLLAAAALPMSGSRAPFLISMALCALVAWRAGLVFTAIGRRIIMLAVAGGFTMVFAFPQAFQGVMDRFQSGDTEDRTIQSLSVLPPVALTTNEYPSMGLGTGMMQNFRGQFGVYDEEGYQAEGEVGRYLVELGVFGYLLVWVAKFGLVMILWNGSKILKKAGRRAAAGGAVAYAVLTLYGSLTFDHIFASLYFVGFGFILQEIVQAWPIATGKPLSGHGMVATGAKAHA